MWHLCWPSKEFDTVNCEILITKLSPRLIVRCVRYDSNYLTNPSIIGLNSSHNDSEPFFNIQPGVTPQAIFDSRILLLPPAKVYLLVGSEITITALLKNWAKWLKIHITNCIFGKAGSSTCLNHYVEKKSPPQSLKKTL